MAGGLFETSSSMALVDLCPWGVKDGTLPWGADPGAVAASPRDESWEEASHLPQGQSGAQAGSGCGRGSGSLQVQGPLPVCTCAGPVSHALTAGFCSQADADQLWHHLEVPCTGS